ncbi:AraC family transcriptional regulator [Sinorhizobium meliloti]|nr:helix-turn-helix domain-containing protein [Sinorhizobium meliloti]RVI27151.1 AraC family transcriptional regulator [Sinorhizobium meliloti]
MAMAHGRRRVFGSVEQRKIDMSFRPLFGSGRIRTAGEQPAQPTTASWAGSSVVFDRRRWTCREAELRWTAPHHVLVLTEEGATSQTSIRSDGKMVYEGRDRSGAITFVPAGVERLGAYRDVDLTYSALWVDPRSISPASEHLKDLPVLINKSDTVISALLKSLSSEISNGHIPDSAYVDHLIALVTLRIRGFADEPVPAPRHGSLGSRVVKRVRDYVDAHLDGDISLGDLADVAGVASDSFARRFKVTTGFAPYAYVLEERIRRSEALLCETDTTLSAIALACGFSSQSHFTTTFKRLRGVTPHAYRSKVIPES